MKIILFLHFILLATFSFSQIDSNTFYHSPLNIPLKLSANFGELRPNHFHMGIDYRTNGVEGIKIFAIEDGYIARVKVSTFGYGKVVYINHPNGITSVYAHCSVFTGKLDSIVKQKQIEQLHPNHCFHLRKTRVPKTTSIFQIGNKHFLIRHVFFV